MMGDIITDLRQTFKRGSIVTQLLFINVGVFVATSLLSVFFMLFNRNADPILLLFELPASVTRFLHQPWSLITYMFMHADVLHILFNMLCLYWFGTIALYFFTNKHLRGIYALGGICGGLLYILSYNTFPYFAEIVLKSPSLVGASASILAIVMATAYREPNYPVRLLLIGTVRLKYLALFVVLIDLMFLKSNNAGGHIAHLGGALAGLWFAASLRKGTDITAWINSISDGIAWIFNKKTWRRKPKMKVHYGGGRTMREKDYDYNAQKKARSDEIDRILDKLKKSGYESLTTEEKKSLFDASKR
jgi:membrane associated rhomboid family serine protease